MTLLGNSRDKQFEGTEAISDSNPSRSRRQTAGEIKSDCCLLLSMPVSVCVVDVCFPAQT